MHAIEQAHLDLTVSINTLASAEAECTLVQGTSHHRLTQRGVMMADGQPAGARPRLEAAPIHST